MATIDNMEASVNGDAVLISGTVDGVVYEVRTWKSHLDKLGGKDDKEAKRAYIAEQLKAAADAAAVVDVPETLDLSGAPIVL